MTSIVLESTPFPIQRLIFMTSQIYDVTEITFLYGNVTSDQLKIYFYIYLLTVPNKLFNVIQSLFLSSSLRLFTNLKYETPAKKVFLAVTQF